MIYIFKGEAKDYMLVGMLSLLEAREALKDYFRPKGGPCDEIDGWDYIELCGPVEILS